MKKKLILGIETSCDETAAAILEGDPSPLTGRTGHIRILSNIVASSKDLQAKYGGIIPEQAAREQIKSIIPVIETAVNDSRLTIKEIDAIAVAQGPGLIGSLLVGVETAKVLSLVWKKPLIPVNHLIGHFYANWISIPASLRDHEVVKQFGLNKIATGRKIDPRDNELVVPNFPCIGLLVSGGHTDLVLFASHGKYQYLGGTRDDAAGECFDKCGRLLGLPYPGGPEIAKLAENGNPKAFNLPRPMIDSDDFDFSFSGLKTAVSNLVKSEVKLGESSQLFEAGEVRSESTSSDVHEEGRAGPAKPEAELENRAQVNERIHNLCASIEQAIIDPLVKKTVLAAQKYNIEEILVAGGVASNQKLVSDLKFKIENLKLKIKLFVPPPYLCTDNAAMIAAAAFFKKPLAHPLKLQANPNLSLAY